ncbi:MAG: DNA topoisomerase IB [Phycisphaerae bacterium]|nr:DNA topoisomerase IB [Phycisphaerae bacterium]
MTTRAKVSKHDSAPAVSETIEQSIAAAEEANLRYTSSDQPGIYRKRRGSSFFYVNRRGKRITDADTLARIRSIVIPPAWKEVWISPHSNGHLQATGTDARGRRQYRYHAKYRAIRDEAKYDHMIGFAHALPRIHRRTNRDLKLPGLPRNKVLAAIVRVMEKTLIRVGNEEYARTNRSYGLTTIHNKHVKVRGRRMHFDFKGKSGVEHEIDLEDPRLAKIVHDCQELPGEELFGYRDENGKVVDVDSADVNEYLAEIAGDHFTAKDFRTWAGTVLAATALQELKEFDSELQAKRNVVKAVESVAKRLGNTKAVCRKCYIHPAIIETYLDGSLATQLAAKAGKELSKSRTKLSSTEAAILGLLQHRLTQKKCS